MKRLSGRLPDTTVILSTLGLFTHLLSQSFEGRPYLRHVLPPPLTAETRNEVRVITVSNPVQVIRLVKHISGDYRRTTLRAVNMDFVESEAVLPGVVRFVDVKESVPALTPGRYLAAISKPNQDGTLEGGRIRSVTGDATLEFAIPVADQFRRRPTESPTLNFYRALSETWDTLPLSQLGDLMKTKMPPLERAPLPGHARFFSDDARGVFEFTRNLSRLRKLVVLWVLRDLGYREAEKHIEELVWQSKDDPDLESVPYLDHKLTDMGMRDGGDFYVDSAEFLRKAEQCSVDQARAFYVRNLVHVKPAELPRLGALLYDSQPRALWEIVTKLGFFGDDETYRVKRPYDPSQTETLNRLVAHWKAIYPRR